jgi:2-dehydro-3-deoxyphosphooctonate aldolase (KDO 8-P synthase)
MCPGVGSECHVFIKRGKEYNGQIGYSLCFKVSWDKVNRTSATKYRGLGLEEGLH